MEEKIIVNNPSENTDTIYFNRIDTDAERKELYDYGKSLMAQAIDELQTLDTDDMALAQAIYNTLTDYFAKGKTAISLSNTINNLYISANDLAVGNISILFQKEGVLKDYVLEAPKPTPGDQTPPAEETTT